MADVEAFLFAGTAGRLETYAAGTVKALLLSTNAVDNMNMSLTNVADIEGDEIGGGTYARQTLTGLDWSTDGTWPGLKADNTTFTGLDVEDPATVGAVVAYDDASGDLVGGVRWEPVPMTGDLPIQWRDGYIATLEFGFDGLLEIVAGANITVDNSDPQRPEIAAIGGGGGAPVSGRLVNNVDGVCDIASAYSEEAHPSWLALPGSGGDPVEIVLPDPATSGVLFVCISDIPSPTPVEGLNDYSFTCPDADGGVTTLGVGNGSLYVVPYICCPLNLPGVFKVWFVFPFYLFDTAPT